MAGKQMSGADSPPAEKQRYLVHRRHFGGQKFTEVGGLKIANNKEEARELTPAQVAALKADRAVSLTLVKEEGG